MSAIERMPLLPSDAVERDRELAFWLLGFGLGEDDPGRLLQGFCEGLSERDVPIARAFMGSDLLHPILDARGYRWERGSDVVSSEFTREQAREPNESWDKSPLKLLVDTDTRMLRRRLTVDYRQGEFPLVDELQDRGFTDYLAFFMPFGRRTPTAEPAGLVCSFATDHRDGFTDPQIHTLRRLFKPLALAYKAIDGVQTVRVLADTYLGHDAGERVLRGEIERGKAEPVQAVLWYSDLQGFTRIADTAPRDVLLHLLNDYADCVVTAVQRRGGEILKFIGDGILGMFPLSDGVAPCTAALDAATDVLTGCNDLVSTRDAAGLPSTGIYIALHVGEVLYGNIGSRDRLDFTVVGPAVNEVARIEALGRSLDQRVIVSAAFAEAAGQARSRLVCLGRYALRGVGRPQELFTLDPDAAAA